MIRGAGVFAVVAVCAGVAPAAAQVQVVPQRGQVASAMEADSVVAWAVRLAGTVRPAPGGEAFDRLGTGVGAGIGVALRFANGLAAGVHSRWARFDDELSGDPATQLEATLDLAWSVGGGFWRLEAGPVLGVTRLRRSVLASAPVGGLGGAGIRAWRAVGSRASIGVAVDALWAWFGELEFDVNLPPDPDARAEGFRPSIDFALELGLGS